jgi:hypothetical protein
MTDRYVFLKFTNKHYQTKYNKIDRRDLYEFTVNLLEEARVRDLGEVYMRHSSDKPWVKIDYYDVEEFNDEQ